MRVLETRIPPPIVMTLFGGLAWLAARSCPALSYALPHRELLAVFIGAAGLVLNVLPKIAFRRAGTTVNPLTPASTKHLVTSGIYRHTRNPMYLGHSIIVLAWSLHLDNFLAFLAIPAFMLYIWRFQIQPEERQLAARFPVEYEAFCRLVPRWL